VADLTRSALRRSTNGLHAQLDELAVTRRLADGSISRHDYIGVLRASKTLFASQEIPARKILRSQAGNFLDRWPARYFDIAADLATLAGSGQIFESTCDSSDTMPTNQPGATPASAAGVLYVLEGSLLGGMAIATALLKNAAWSRELPMRFHGQPAQSALQRWRAYSSLLEQLVRTEADIEQAATAARLTFQAFINDYRKI